jgi:hypothetical protein
VVDGLLGDVPPGHLLAGHVADVVDDRVDAAELGERGVGQGRHLGPGGDVGLQEDGVGALRADPFGGLLGAGFGGAVMDADHAGALLGGPDGDLGAEAGAGAGDEHRPAFEAAGEGQRRERHDHLRFPTKYRICRSEAWEGLRRARGPRPRTGPGR